MIIYKEIIPKEVVINKVYFMEITLDLEGRKAISKEVYCKINHDKFISKLDKIEEFRFLINRVRKNDKKVIRLTFKILADLGYVLDNVYQEWKISQENSKNNLTI